MVLTFDIMDEATRDSITTDFEIVINGHNLMDMLDVCVAHKHNRLSSAPASHIAHTSPTPCLLYTSDAADEEDSVDLGGRRIIKKTIISPSAVAASNHFI
eukprot:TRINITY_DN52287_c0_g1_i1.p2 TRINITY_DN52287_c0_g1~~TRINITY_DN52287_c0_g1_i1.p2  ORF type:complete len:100 (-),score=27.75 TRINITY_DN52287_c0_g1_i1:43-342(-)